MRQYTYSPTVRLGIVIQQTIGVVGLLLSTGITILVFWGTGEVKSVSPINLLEDPRLTLVCLGIWTLVIGWTIGLALINAFPIVWLGESGITISAYLFLKIHIPWSDILALNLGGVRFGHDLVVARRISFFHRIYGLQYSRTLHPSFMIRKDMIDREELITEIKHRIQKPG